MAYSVPMMLIFMSLWAIYLAYCNVMSELKRRELEKELREEKEKYIKRGSDDCRKV